MLAGIEQYAYILEWCALLSAGTFVLSLIVIPWLILRLPADFFISRKTIWNGAKRHHPLLFLLFRIIKNLAGIILLLAGILMLVLPGQGLLTMVIGLGLINFPGKHELHARLVNIPSVLRSLNWIRKKGKRPPFETTTSSFV